MNDFAVEDHLDDLPTDSEMRRHVSQTNAHIETVKSLLTVAAIKITAEGRLMNLSPKAEALLERITDELHERAQTHDQSKLEPPEKEVFAAITPKLEDLEYGSPDYESCLEKLGPALDHHYEVNDHHPEHYSDGVESMTLPALIEMCCDWVASGQRHEDGSIYQSVHVNQRQYDLPDLFAYRTLGTMYRLKYKEMPRPQQPEQNPGTFFGITAHFCALHGEDPEEHRERFLTTWGISPMLRNVFLKTCEHYSVGYVL